MRPYSTIGGIERTAIAKPAGPIVSWPTTSCASAVASSFARCAAPPTRMLVMTKVGAFDRGFRRRLGSRDLHTARHLRGEAGDHAQAILVDVVERDVADLQVGA